MEYLPAIISAIGTIIAAWFAYTVKDAAIVNTGVSRWHNYYMEGLDWLLKHVGIDGLYIDDLAFDRMSMKRVRKILNRTNPGALIDLHSANQYNEWARCFGKAATNGAVCFMA